MQDNLQEAVEVLSQALQSNPLSRLAWLQFIFEGDATKFPPNFSASSDGNVGIGASSHGCRLSMDDVPQIVFRCDLETFCASCPWPLALGPGPGVRPVKRRGRPECMGRRSGGTGGFAARVLSQRAGQ